VTAQDYEYAWKRLCDPETAAPYAEDMGVFLKNGIAALEGEAGVDQVGVKATGDKTLVVTLDGPCPFFDQIAVFPVFYPTRKDMVDTGENWWTDPKTCVTNGPFKLKSFTLDQDMVVVPNTSYYEASKVQPASVTFKFLADENVALSAIRATSPAAPPPKSWKP